MATLLENPNMETQAKESVIKKFFRVLIIFFLFFVITIGYVLQFSSNDLPKILERFYIGTYDASNFYNVKDFELVVIDSYGNINDMKTGDIICFSNKVSQGSGVLLEMKSGVLLVEMQNGEIKRINEDSVLGKQIKAIPVLGAILKFVGSYLCIIIFNLILLAYLSYLTFKRINYENTDHGKMLYKKFRLTQKEFRQRKRTLKKMRNVDDIEYAVADLLDGTFEENKAKFLAFRAEDKLPLKEKYKYILKIVHDAYLPKEDLDRQDRKHISKVVELMCVVKDFDVDIEYLIIDLLIKCPLIDFDEDEFLKSATEFLNDKLDDDDLLYFGSVFYIMLLKNKRLRDKKFIEVVKLFLLKSNENKAFNNNLFDSLARNMLILLK